MRLALLGVRGSTPAPGPDFVRFGGHTSCLAVLRDGEAVPSLVLDAGTGIRRLPGLLGGAPFRGAVVLSHLHWDHVYGLPFCPSLDNPAAMVELHLPPTDLADRGMRSGPDAEALLARVMAPPFFPIDPGGLLGSWTFRMSGTGRLSSDLPAGAQVELAPVRHKGGVTFAIRVNLDGASVAYVPDHTLRELRDGSLVDTSGEDAAAIDLVHGVDVLLHDGQFAGSGEAKLAADYGHSTIEDAMAWADRCRVGRLVLTHHAPSRTDRALEALAARFTVTPAGRPVSFAREGDILAVTDEGREGHLRHRGSGGAGSRPRP